MKVNLSAWIVNVLRPKRITDNSPCFSIIVVEVFIVLLLQLLI